MLTRFPPKSSVTMTLLALLTSLVLLTLGGCADDTVAPADRGAEMAVAMDLQPALNSGSDVTRVRVVIEKGDFVDEMDLDIAGAMATGTFPALEPGEYVVSVYVYDDEVLIAQGFGTAVVTAGQTAQVTIDVTRLQGGLTVTVRWDCPGCVPALAHWKFNRNADGVLRDLSGNGHDGIVTDAAWAAGADGWEETALAFDGAASGVEVPSSAAFSGMSRLTVEAVFKVSALPDLGEYDTLVGVYDEFLGFSAATRQAFRLCLDGMADGTRLRFSVRLDAAHAFDETEVVHTFASFPVDTWVHVAAVFDDGAFTMYLDGEPLASFAAYPSATLATADTPLTIGYSIGTNNANDDRETHFHGVIDEIRITPEALGPDGLLEP